MKLLEGIQKSIFGVSLRHTQTRFRGFHYSNQSINQLLETIGAKFLYGYHLGLQIFNLNLLNEKLSAEADLYQGFCYEGAAMATAILDGVSLFKKNRTSDFLISNEGQKHAYMIHVGVGWAYARLPVTIEKKIEKYDPVLRWLIMDGYGFHQAYFKTKKYVFNLIEPKELKKDFSKHVFYQGVGRCLWFIEGTDALRIADRIKSFHSNYQPDLWSGVGLACTYAGGVSDNDIIQIKSLSGDFLPYLMQGAAFAAKARERAETIVPHVEMACKIICGMTVHEASVICDNNLTEIPENVSSEEKYESWRSAIRLDIFKKFDNEKIYKEVSN